MKKVFKELNKKELWTLIIVTIISLLIRLLWFNGETGDYTGFLKPWVEDIRDLGYFKALKYNIGNYNIPYLIILTFISFLKMEPLYPIKIVSIIFDLLCAIYSAKIVNYVSKNKKLSLLTYCIVFSIPTVLVNGAMWAQCDSIYTFFILVALYYLLKEKYTKSFIFLGLSFSFKLQFIFILPLFVLMFFREKKIHLYHFLLIPLVNFLMCLPAIIMGRSIMDTMMIYFGQVEYYKDLVLNFPNLYNLIQSNIRFFLNNYELLSKIGIIITLLIFVCIWLYTILKKVRFDSEKIITVGVWSIVICTYFLPRMHDRYMFAADILSVIWYMIYQKKFHIVITINVISLLTYFRFLFHLEFINFNVLSVIYFIILLEFSIYVIKMLGENNEVKRSKVGRKKLQKVS